MLCLMFLGALVGYTCSSRPPRPFIDASKLGFASACEADPTARNIGDRATCTYTRSVDRDDSRIPPEIPMVKCRCRDSLCRDLGDFRCKEVREKILVAYRKGAGSLEYQNKTFEVTTACVCAANRSVKTSGGVTRIANVGEKHRGSRDRGLLALQDSLVRV